jgi:hypothetical protein
MGKPEECARIITDFIKRKIQNYWRVVNSDATKMSGIASTILNLSD